MNSLTLNLKIYSEPTQTVINKFYPYWIYVTNPAHDSAKKRLENTIKEMQECQF